MIPALSRCIRGMQLQKHRLPGAACKTLLLPGGESYLFPNPDCRMENQIHSYSHNRPLLRSFLLPGLPFLQGVFAKNLFAAKPKTQGCVTLAAALGLFFAWFPFDFGLISHENSTTCR